MKNNLIKRILLGALSLTLLTSPVSEEKILKNTKERYEKEITNSFDSLQQIKYLNDKKDSHPNSRDYWQTPEEADSLKTGDCEDKSIYLMNKLSEKGINAHLVYGALGNSRDRSKHVWIEYNIGKKDYAIECSQKGMIYDKDTLPSKNGYTFTHLYDPAYISYMNSKIKEFNKRSKFKIDFINNKKRLSK